MLGTYCEFADIDTEIVRKVIQRCASTKLRRSFLKEAAIDIKKILALGVIHDTLDSQIDIVEGKTTNEHNNNNVDFINNKKKAYHKNPSKSHEVKKERKCFKCGRAWPHDEAKPCPALENRGILPRAARIAAIKWIISNKETRMRRSAPTSSRLVMVTSCLMLSLGWPIRNFCSK
jgi:hypothetical protein